MKHIALTNKFIKNLGKKLFIIAFLGLGINAYSQNCSVNANIEQTICPNSSFVLVGSKTGLFQGGAGYQLWTQIGGPSVTITNPTQLSTTVTGFAANTSYKFRLTTTCLDGALVFDTVIYNVLPHTISNAGPDQYLCPGVYTLSGNLPGTGESGSWSIVGSANGLVLANSTSPNATITLPGAYSGPTTLRWTISSLNGCSSYDDVIIYNRGGILPISAGPFQTLSQCYSTTSTATLGASYAGTGIDGQIGTWSVISGPNMPGFGNPNSNTSTVNNLIQGTYILRWTVTGPCVNGYDEMQITVPAPVGSVSSASITSGNQIFCDTRTTAVLSGTPTLYINETAQWIQTGGPACTIVNPTSSTTSVTGLNGSSTYTFVYKITNSFTGCSSTSSSRTISYTVAPSINAGADKILAPDATTATINWTSIGGNQTRYNVISYPAGYTPPGWTTTTSPTTISGLNFIGTYVVQFRRYTNGGTGACSEAFDDVNIFVSKTPTGSNAGTDQVLACNITNTSLVGNTPIIGFGIWSQVSGPNTAVISDIYAPTTPISNLIPGIYTFRWSISAGINSPVYRDDVSVKVVSAVPSNVNAGSDRTVCYSSPITMHANTLTLNESGTWTVSPSSGVSISNIHSPTAVVTGLAPSTTYTFTWTVFNACGSLSDDVIITTTSSQGPVQATAGADQCQPAGTSSITLAGNNPSPGTGTWTKVSGPSCTITNANQNNTTVTGLSNGTYKFQWAIMFNGCGPTLDTVSVTVSSSGSTAAAGPDQSICGTSVTLAGNTPTVGTGLWTIVSSSGGAAITSPTSPTTTVTGLTDDIYIFRWTISNEACPSSSDDVQVNVSTPPTVANAGADQNICGGTTAVLSANTITSGTGTWSIVSAPSIPTFSNVNAPDATISGLVMGTYTLRWTAQAGSNCGPSTDDVLINVAPNATAGATQNLCNVTTTILTGNSFSIGTWTLVSGPNTPTITPAGSNTANVTGMITGSYVFRYTINSGFCPSTSATVTVNTSVFGTNPTAGPDQNLCGAASFTMAGNPPAIGIGTWTKVSGPSGGSFSPSANAADATFSPAQAGVYYFNWTVTNGGCTLSDQVKIENFANPTTANAGPDQDVCGLTATFAGNTPVSGTGNWTLVSGPGTATITAPISPISSVTVSTSGSYIFKWTISNGVCASSSDDVSINFKTLPTTANAGADQSLCNITSATLAGNNITTGSGAWSLVSGPNSPTITNASLPNSTVTGLISGTYVFRWTSTYNGCSTTDDIQIIISALPTTANAGPDQNLCNYAAVALGGNTPSIGTGTWTQISGPNTATISSPNSPSSGVLGTIVGSYVFRWTISNGTCVTSSDDVTININENPSLAVAGFDQNLCNIFSASMAATSPTIGTGTWTRVSGPNTPSINNIHSATTSISGLVAGTYIFDWTVANGTCTSSDQMQIQVDGLPTTPNAGPDQNLCNVTTVTMAGNSPITGTGVWSRLSGPNTPTINDPSSPTTSITGMTTGTYIFRWTISNGSCTPLTDDVQIIISEAVTSSNAGTDQNQCNVTSITMTANTPSVGVGNWSMISGPNSPTITNANTSNTTITGLIAGTYVFQWTITNGACSSADQVQIINYATPTTSNAGPDQTLCGVTSAIFAGNSPSTGIGLWTVVSGPNTPTITSSSSPNSTVTGLIPGTYIFRWTIINGTCTNSTDDVQIVITEAASTANAGPDQNPCNVTSITMAGNTPSSGTGTWTMVSGPNTPTITSPNSPTTTISGLIAGTYIFKWEITLGTCSSSDQVQIINSAIPTTSNAGPDQALCNVTTANLAGNSPTSGTGTWTRVSGPNTPTITTPSSPTSSITGMIAGTYIFRWTISNGTCTSSSDDVQITISAAATTANAGTDQNLCNLNAVTMAGNTPISGTGTWSIISGPNTPSISNINTPTTTITGLVAGTYIFEWTITNGACSSTDQVQINNYATPTTANAGNDQTLCNVTSATMAGNNPSTGSGSWSVVSGPNSPTITTPSSASSTITGMVAGTYIFRWTISNGTCTNSSDDVQVVISANSTIANAGSDQAGISMCGLTSTTLAGNTPSSGTGLWTIVSGSGGNITTPSSPNSTFTGVSGTSYVLKWTITNPPCPASEDLVSITFESLPAAPTAANSDRNNLCPNDLGNISLSATGGSGTTLRWFTGSCGGTAIGTGSPIVVSAPTSTTTYYARWENLCGNSTCATVTVTVADNVNPTITCPADIVTTVNPGSCNASIADLGTPVTNDNCSVASVTNNAPSVFPLGNTTVVWTVTDGSGNTATCNQIVKVSDNINPSITCGVTGPQNVNANASCKYNVTWTTWNATANDNCGVASVTYVLTGATTGTGTTLNGVSFNLGTTTVTWTATDNSGNTATCSYTVIVTDNTNPVISSCGGSGTLNVNANSSCKYIVSGTAWDATATDNCGTATLAYALSGATTGTGTSLNGISFNLGTTNVVWTATDNAGNTTICNFTVIVADHTNPTIISCGATGTQTVGANSGCNYQLSGTAWDAVATDNCAVSTLTYVLTGNTIGTGTTLNGVTFNSGSTTVTWTATDAAGNSANCSFTVIVADNINPVISSCGTTGTQNVNANSSCKYIVGGTAWDATATDNCGVSTLAYTLSGATTGTGLSLNGVSFNIGSTTVTWTATDAAGNTSSCNFIVIVTDNTNPVISSCGASGTQNVNTNTACTYSLSTIAWNATATDNCGVTSLTYQLTGATTGSGTTLNGVAFNLGTTTVTWTATDAAGNTATCNFNVIVSDNILPVFASCGATGTQNVFANSACKYVVSGTAWNPNVVENCGTATVAYTLSGATTGTGTSLNGVTFNIGTTNVLWTATDAAGNTSTCNFNVVVTDNTNPIITSCGATGTQNVNANSGCSYVLSGTAWNATATDNCGVASLNYTLTGATSGTGATLSGVSFNSGTTTVTWTATDAAGNTASCNFTVVVADNINPVISSCGVTGTQNVNANSSCKYIVSGTAWDATATDNCGVSTLGYTLSGATTGAGVSLNGVSFNLGNTLVTWTATDAAGNTSSCNFTIIVTDNTNPVISSCGATGNQTVNSNSGCKYVVSGTAWNATATDNCGMSTLTYTLSGATTGTGTTLNGVIFNTGTTTVTWTATDVAGNTSSCNFNVIVTDNINPVISSCGATGTQTVSANSSCKYVVSGTAWDATATDNCGVSTIIYTLSGATTGTGASLNGVSFNAGTTIVTWTVTDAAGNTASCNFSVNVKDITNPVISSCGGTGTQNVNSNSGCNYIVSGTAWDAIATDNCGVSSLVYTLSGATTGTGTTLNGITFNSGTTTVSWTATDAAGNNAICSFIVVVADNVNPVISSCGATGNQNVTANSSCKYIVSGTAWDATATDNCGISTLVYTLSGASTGTGTSLNGISFNIGSTTVTWTATDAAGNTSSCNFSVIVTDNTNPVISSCGASGTQNVTANSSCKYIVTGTAWDATATDNCGVSSLNYTLTGATTGNGTTLNGVVFNSGTTTVTWKATDAAGNTASCNFNVVVTDNTNPVISSCGATGTQTVNANSSCKYTITGTLWDAIATDNCGVSTLTYSLSGATSGTGSTLNGVVLNSGTTTVTWTATDAAGNSANCNFTVIVADQTNPVITSCGASGNQNVNSNSGCHYILSGTAWDAVATDNCGISTITYSLTGATSGTGTSLNGITFNSGTTTVTWTALDAAGNSTSCNFNVIVTDIINPIISSCGATGTQSVTANSACKYVISGTAWDAVATDNCGVSTLTYTLSGATTGTGSSLNGAVLNIGTTIVTWLVTDAAGNTATCNFTVIVTDNTNPVISSCGATGTQNVTSNAACKYVVNGTVWDAIATDNCGVSTLTYTLSGATTGTGTTLNGVIFNSGNTTVTWTAADAAGNTTSCNFTVIVTDIISPVISSCGATGTQNVNANSSCKYINSGTAWDAVATDNCGVSTITYTLSGSTTGTGTSLNGVTFNSGNTLVTWLVTDAAGNTATCNFNVVVTDNTNPVISSCGSGGTQNVSSNSGCNYLVSGTAWDAVATDNCGVSALTYTLSGATSGAGTTLNGITFNSGTTTVVWTALDNAGNSSTCNFTVVVSDHINPIISSCGVGGNQNVNSNSACQYIVSGTAWDAIATDNCGTPLLTYTLSGSTTGTGVSLNGVTFNSGNTLVTWLATDAAGNTATCSFNVIVTDNTNPTIICAAPVTINTSPGSCNAIGVTLTAPTVSDNCSVSSLVNNAPFIYPAGITNVLWIVTDASGNSASCTQTVRVNASPLASNDIYVIQEDTPSPFSVLTNDYDCDNNLNPSTVQVVAGPSHGSVTINITTGVITYTPATNYNGTDQFNYTVCDSTGLCSTATVFITIIGLNDPPVTINEHIIINEDTPTSGSVLANGDYDPDGTALFVNTTPLTGPSHGIFTINVAGTYNYTPNLNYNGSDIVIVSVCDNGNPLPSACANDTIFITINPINDPPVTFNEHFNTNMNVSVSASVLTNGDYDPDGTALNVATTAISGPTHGVITLNSNGSFNYIPTTNYYGNDMVVVNVCDNGIPMPSACAVDTIFFTINAVNLPPVTTNEKFIICQNEAHSGNVLLNGDYDPDGTTLTVSSPAVYGPLHGSFSISSNGNYTYTPTTGFYGLDVVVVNICDNGIPLPPACSYDTLFITVNQNTQAFGGQDQNWCNENNTFLTGNLPAGSTGNWTQLSGPNTVVISPPNTSAVSVNGMIIGTYYFIYTLTTPNSTGYCFTTDTVKVTNHHFPSIAYAGPDQFICYNGGQTTSIVLNGNIPTYGYGVWQQVLGPTVAVFADSLNHNTTVSNLTNGEYGFNWVIRSGPCAPAYDYVHIKINHEPNVDAGPDGQICHGGVWPLTGATASNYLSIHWTTTGTGTFSNPTSLNPVYTPSLADEAVGSVTLTLYANGINVCPDNSDAMVLTINAIPPPLACPNDTVVYTDQGLCSAYVNVPLTNLSISTNCITSIINSYTNTDNASGTYPLGTTTVFWTAIYADGTSTSCAHNVTVIDSIRPQITCPGDITQTINSGCNTTALIPTVNYADNCIVTSLTWTMTGATTASSPSTGFNQIGSYTFGAGLTTVTYTVTDGANNSTSCSFTVNFIDNVIPTIICPGPITINTLPGACNATTVSLGNPITFDNCAVDTVFNNAPALFPIGTTTVIWTVADNFGNTATCNQIIAVNSAPLAVNDADTTNEESPVTINVIANDLDCGNDLNPGSVIVTSGPTNGTTTVDPVSGNITYNPNTNYYGPDQFNYQVCDSNGLCSTATVFITVLPINHPPITVNEHIAFCQGGNYSGDILANGDHDPEGMPLSVVTTAVSGPANGTISIAGNGSFTYNPNPGFFGTDQIIVSVCDNGTPPPLNLPPACSNDTIFINVNQFVIANGGPDQEWCNNTNTFLVGNGPSGTSGNWVQISGPNTVVISPPNSPYVSVGGMTIGNYQFVYTLTTLNPTGNCISTDTVNVINYHLPSISYAGPDQVLCLSGGTTTSTTITANNPQFGYGVWEQVLGPTVVNFADSLNQVTVISNLAAGEYGFNWVIYNGICEPEYDYLHITVNPTPIVNAGPDAQTCQGIPYTLSGATASGYESMHWSTSGTGTFDDPIAVNPIYTPSLADAVAGSVTLTITGEGFSPCPDMTDAMVLTVTLNPILTCPPSINQFVDQGSCFATVVDTLPAIITNSGCVTSVINSYNSTNNASGIYPIGTTNIIWTVTFLDGSVITCNQAITVTDNINPTITCSGNINQNIISGCSTSVTIPPVQYTDNCTPTNLTWTMTGATVASSALSGFNQVGTHTFNVGVTTITYTVSDSAGNTTNCTSVITIVDNINPTIACAGSITVQSDPGSCVASGVLLTNPTTGDNCSVTSVTNNAPLNFPVGTTVVVWTASDSSGNTATCTQTVTVIGAPLAVNDYDTTSVNTPITVAVLANDLDCDNNLNPGSVYVNGQPSNGTVTVNPTTGDITYTPNNNYYGNDQFNYQVCDFTGFCSTATVFIGVGINNNVPYVPDSTVTINEDETVTICLPIIDPDGPLPFNLNSVGCFSNGNASAIIAGNNVCITYIPNPNYNGLDSVCVVVCDGGGLCDTATLVITILPVNDPPIVPDTALTTPMDSTITACLPITDIDGSAPFSVSNVGCYSNGTATAQIVGNTVCVTYIPNPGFIGTDSICMTICDSAGACDTTIITIDVTPPLAKAVIGLAKEADTPELQPDGSYNVSFLFTVQNLGNTKLTNVQVADSMIATFPAPAHFTIIVPPVSTGTLTPNSNYNGMNDVNLLVDTASYVNVGMTETISLVVNIKTVGFFGPYYNSARASALDTTGMASIDTSNNGTIVDPNGNGDPNEAAENIPTPIVLTPNTVIGVAKAASTPELQSDGSYNVTFVVTVQNMGNDTLRNVKVTDDLASTFPSPAVFSVTGMPTVSGTLQPNSSFNGSSDIDLIISPSSMLDTGATATITFTVNVIIPMGSQNTYYNFAIGFGHGNGGIMTSDTSNNGYDPDPNHNGKPNDSTENTATPIILNSLDIFIPEGFSPNGDGINDYFVIRGLETYPDNILSVYNRWGNLIYQKKGYDNTWDGTSNSHNMNLGRDKVQPGTYFYILELNKDEKKPMNGYVVIQY